MSSNLGPLLFPPVEKNPFGSSILYLGSGEEKLESYCSDSFPQISCAVLNISSFILKGPIILLVLSFFFAYVKKCFGFVLMFLIACVSFSIFSFLWDFNNFLSMSTIALSMQFFFLVLHLFNFKFNFFFFLNSIFLSLGILFVCEPLGNLNLEVLFIPLE